MKRILAATICLLAYHPAWADNPSSVLCDAGGCATYGESHPTPMQPLLLALGEAANQLQTASGTMGEIGRTIGLALPADPHAPANDRNTFIGYCAGALNEDADHHPTVGRTILIGLFTAAPPGAIGFVNIGNRWCGWIDSGERVPCPEPVTLAQCKP